MTGGLLAALLLPPLGSAALALIVRPYRRWVAGWNAALSIGAFAAALGLAGRVVAGEVPVWGPGELLRVDALSALLAVCVAAVGALAAMLGPGLGGCSRCSPTYSPSPCWPPSPPTTWRSCGSPSRPPPSPPPC
jgi:formate hydrogenlyase subunit 3/multisubunit Na+/H+ antiporter MnhD subunit